MWLACSHSDVLWCRGLRCLLLLVVCLLAMPLLLWLLCLPRLPRCLAVGLPSLLLLCRLVLWRCSPLPRCLLLWPRCPCLPLCPSPPPPLALPPWPRLALV